MRIVIQRVKRASVEIGGRITDSIGAGMLILLGIEPDDSGEDIEWLAGKAFRLRIFADEAGVMNRDLTEAGGEVMVVSQFTLHASTRKGNRPSYIRAAGRDIAIPLYERFITKMEELTGKRTAHGEFGADMQVELVNDGPVTILIDSKNRE